MFSSVRPSGPYPARLPCPWECSSKNTGGGCHFFLQEICLTQGLNPCLLRLLHWQADSLPLNHSDVVKTPLHSVLGETTRIIPTRPKVPVRAGSQRLRTSSPSFRGICSLSFWGPYLSWVSSCPSFLRSQPE